jgi:hypothetical protein
MQIGGSKDIQNLLVNMVLKKKKLYIYIYIYNSNLKKHKFIYMEMG